MSYLRHRADLDVLVVTKGHPFERDAFADVFERWRGVRCSLVEQPAAQLLFGPRTADHFGAIVFYDMPGIEFGPGRPPRFHDPPPAFADGLRAVLEAGIGIVFLHHAVAGWPSWEAYSALVGARFLYAPGEVRGRRCAASGYRHAVRHRLRCVDPAHPVLQGLEDGFEIEDELYLCEIFENEVVPLLRSDYAFQDDHFFSAELAVRGEMDSRRDWSHGPGSDLQAWAKRAGRSPVVTILAGDGPSAYASPGFRRLLENAVRWVASDAARAWAARAG